MWLIVIIKCNIYWLAYLTFESNMLEVKVAGYSIFFYDILKKLRRRALVNVDVIKNTSSRLGDLRAEYTCV